jgi:hypothetical protein
MNDMRMTKHISWGYIWVISLYLLHIKLGLLFMMVKPLSKGERITSISQGLKTMPVEEAYYWFSKCADPKFRERARRALRILLAGE